MVNNAIPTGKAVAAGGEVTVGTVAGDGVWLGAAAVLVSDGMNVEVARAAEGVSLGGGLLGSGVTLGTSGVFVLGAGAHTLGVAVTIAMAVADGGTGVAGADVDVTSAGVGGLGVSVPTTQPVHKTTDAKIKLPSRRRSMASL